MPALPPSTADLGRVLSDLRQERGLTVADLAWMANMHPTYLARVERGCANPSWLELCDLASAFGVLVSAVAQDAEDTARATRMEVTRCRVPRRGR
jgi:transcriptional regulator with XRE-family HTH domain